MSTKKKVSGFNERNKYAKIPIKIKVKFLRKVVIDGLSIRDVKSFSLSPPPSLTSITPLPKHSFGSTGPISSNTASISPPKNRPLCLMPDLGWDAATRSWGRHSRWRARLQQTGATIFTSKEGRSIGEKLPRNKVGRRAKSILSQFSIPSSRSSVQFLTFERWSFYLYT